MFGRFSKIKKAATKPVKAMTQENNELISKALTVGQFFDALSAAEYPDYILELISKLQEWMAECIGGGEGKKMDPVTAMFESEIDPDMDALFSSISWIEQYADLIPNNKRPEGREEVVIVNVGGGDSDSCLRIAIDYASIFNQEHCRRVWIVSDSFDLVDVSNYIPHVSKLTERGVTFRFLLVCPWGWVEIPLDGDGDKHQLFWKGLSALHQKT